MMGQQAGHVRRAAVSLPVLGALLWLIAGCSGSDAGYGVVLWGGNSFSLKPGVIVDVHDEHKLDDALTVSLKSDDVRFKVKKGFIKRFPTAEGAKQFRRTYREYLDLFARARLDGVLVRQKPSQSSRQVYRLRKGEQLKVVLSESTEKKVEGRLGKWYLVVTENGYRGYSFGPYLYFHGKSAEPQKYREEDRRDELLERLCASVWRPAYMKEGLRRERINLEQLDPEMGLFPDEEAEILRLRTKEVRREYTLDSARPAGKNTLRFAQGALELAFTAEDSLMARYEYRGKIVRDRFVQLDVELEERIEKEKERRKELYASFLSRNGKTFVSGTYGTLRFAEDGNVRWTGRYDLPRNILPPDAAATGTVLFNLYLSPALRKEYDGAFSMRFPLGNRESRVRFLYRWLSGGLQLTFVPAEAVEKQKVRERRHLFLVMYFRKKEGPPSQ